MNSWFKETWRGTLLQSHQHSTVQTCFWQTKTLRHRRLASSGDSQWVALLACISTGNGVSPCPLGGAWQRDTSYCYQLLQLTAINCYILLLHTFCVHCYINCYILLLSIVTAIRKSQKQSNTSIKGCVMWVPPSVCHWVTCQCWICRCIGHNPDLGRDMSLCILHVKHLDSWLLQINDWELLSFTKRNVLLTCFSKLLKLLYRVRGSVKIHESPESLWAWFSYLWVLLFLEVEVNLPLVEREWFNLKCSITTCSLAERMGKSEGVFSITQNQHNSSSPDRRMAW